VEYEDRVTIATPEGVDVVLELAGLGSRIAAETIDLLIKAAVIAAALVALLVPTGGSGFAAAASIVVASLVLVGYDILFETLGDGRTPGKRALGLRVVRAQGQPIGLRSSTVRNVLRFVDVYVLFGLIGMASIVATRRNQRLGDLAADALVVRGRFAPEAPRSRQPAAAELPPDLRAWDVSAVSVDELATVRQFLDRRATLTPESRRRLGSELARRLRSKVAGAPPGLPPEAFLEQLAYAKGARG
jgi:uncharacterized RDD family membrane protein YckC